MSTALSGAAIQDPFKGSSYGNMYLLNQITATGMSTFKKFVYDPSGEMTSFTTTPLGGAIGWAYNKSNYSSASRTYMEVIGRTLQPSSGGTTYNWTVKLGPDSNGLHSTGTVQDVTAQSQKMWTFNTSSTALAGNTPYPDALMGYLTAYQESSVSHGPKQRLELPTRNLRLV